MLELGKLPNLRRLIVPDEGYTLIDMDLERADLYVVAWDSGCLKLQERLRAMDIHTYHADTFLGGHSKYERDLMKKLVHAGNYLVGPRTASLQTGLAESVIYRFLEWYYSEYPEIGSRDKAHPNPNCWHEKVKAKLWKDHVITNAFGYRRPFFDRVESCLPEAVAWIPQSTVGLVINKALDNIQTHLSQLVQLLLQVHDSLTMQVLTDLVANSIPLIREQSLITIPYPQQLIIPVSFKTSTVSWGDVKDYAIAA